MKDPISLAAIISFSSILISIGGSWAVTRNRQKVHENVLFAKDGRLNLITSITCRETRELCKNENEKDHKNIVEKLDDLKKSVEKAETKRENAREEQIKFQEGIETHLKLVSKYVQKWEEILKTEGHMK